MTRLSLERHQVWVYLLAIGVGLVTGTAWPAAGPLFEALLWPAIALLMLATFLQVPLLHVREALRDRRFAAAMLVGNFVVVPLLAWLLVELFQVNDVVRLGVLLVLLVPCTDWFITFTQLGKGDVPRAVAFTPLNLLLQFLLLPAYLWLMADTGSLQSWEWTTLASATAVVLVPLFVAAVTERWMEQQPDGERLREAMAWGPVPLLGLVLLAIAGAQVGAVRAALGSLITVLPLFVLFLVGAVLLASAIGRWFGLPVEQGRTLAFSMGTRNSFIVLPLALALPQGWELAALVIVFQSLVELFGMVACVWAIPRQVFRS